MPLAVAAARRTPRAQLLQRDPHLVELAHRLDARRGRAHAAPAIADDVAVAFQPAQRLAHGRATRREVLGELLLDEPPADGHVAAQEALAQLDVDAVGRRRAACAVLSGHRRRSARSGAQCIQRCTHRARHASHATSTGAWTKWPNAPRRLWASGPMRRPRRQPYGERQLHGLWTALHTHASRGRAATTTEKGIDAPRARLRASGRARHALRIRVRSRHDGARDHRHAARLPAAGGLRRVARQRRQHAHEGRRAARQGPRRRSRARA